MVFCKQDQLQELIQEEKDLEDKAQKEDLINHPKEIAEHVMLLDLERNDMGRVCEYGSVFVNEVMTLETYPFVHHIVSNIKGKLMEGLEYKRYCQSSLSWRHYYWLSKGEMYANY